MAEFNKKEFGEKLRNVRKSKGLSLENIGKAIGKNATTVGRYESGEILPDAEQIYLLCNELEISESELFNRSKIQNIENSKNPFEVNTLFLYYIAYFPKTDRYDKGKFKLTITEKEDMCQVDMVDYKTNKIYLSGYVLADSNIAVFVLENYKPNNLRLEITEIILNIARGTNELMLGSLHCTNGNYVPSNRKCIISKKDLEFSDDMLEKLKITKSELDELNEKNILYLDVINKYDFEE
ncbi:MAG: helix-turn-helix transcriptional regulator [Clostridia bacterium]|nr:helix-turn-helix transcriptional regulator [Clostridia bacterium]MBP3503413.1 helix-turn-helix transcriptional regulator [Clostridia bacterium]